jgi:hypothetical protein
LKKECSTKCAGETTATSSELLELSPEERARAARALLDSLDEGGASADELREAWTGWVARGPQGPIEDEGDEAGAWPSSGGALRFAASPGRPHPEDGAGDPLLDRNA